LGYAVVNERDTIGETWEMDHGVFSHGYQETVPRHGIVGKPLMDGSGDNVESFALNIGVMEV
jgi:hypothetical protein